MLCIYIYPDGTKKGQQCYRQGTKANFCYRHNPNRPRAYEIPFADFLEETAGLTDEQVDKFLDDSYKECEAAAKKYHDANPDVIDFQTKAIGISDILLGPTQCKYIYPFGNRKGQQCTRSSLGPFFCSFCPHHNKDGTEDKRPYRILFADFLEEEHQMKDDEVFRYLPTIYDNCSASLERYFEEATDEDRENLKERVAAEIRAVRVVTI